jgi:hypothetical protein
VVHKNLGEPHIITQGEDRRASQPAGTEPRPAVPWQGAPPAIYNKQKAPRAGPSGGRAGGE